MRVMTSLFRSPDKSKLTRDLRNLQIFSSIWTLRPRRSGMAGSVNCPQTLSHPIPTKARLNAQVKESNPDSRGILLLFKQNLAFGKLLFQFYKSGVKNVWDNKTAVNTLRTRTFAISNTVTQDGKTVRACIPSFNELTRTMSQALYMSGIELGSMHKNSKNQVKHTRQGPTPVVDDGIFNISRSQYQLIRRTEADFFKLPVFALLAMVFAEMTPILCYAIPEITPLTCVLPSIVPRMWKPQSLQILSERYSERREKWDEDRLQTAFNLPIEETRLLCGSLRLVSKYIPISLYPESYLRNSLQQYYNYLKVDNYFLAGLDGPTSENVWNLSDAELVIACLERNLIEDIGKDLKALDEYTDPDQKQSYHDTLRLKLIQFIVDFDTSNVGYLGLALLAAKEIDVEKLLQLRESK